MNATGAQPTVRVLLEVQTRDAIAAKREDAVHLFDALMAYVNAASVAPVANEKPLRLVTKAELKSLLGIASSRTIEAMMKDGRIPPEAVVRVGRRVRFDLALVLDALRGKRGPRIESAGAAWARRRAAMKVVDGGAS